MSKTNFVDGDPSRGILGTVVTADFLNVLNKHHHTGLDQDGHGALPYAADTGTANAYVVNLNPPVTQYINGMPIFFKAANANTGASTVDVNALGAKTIKKNTAQDLAAGDIQAGQIVMMLYDGVNFQLTGGVDAHTVDGYHASQIPAANTVPVSGSNSKLAWGWRPAFRGALVTITSNQALIPSGGYAVLPWNSEVYDTDNMHDNATNNTRLTVPAGVTKIKLAAHYRITGTSLTWNDSKVKKNGSDFYFPMPYMAGENKGSIAGIGDLPLTPPIPVVEGEYFEFFAGVSGGTGIVLDAAGTLSDPWFYIEVVE